MSTAAPYKQGWKMGADTPAIEHRLTNADAKILIHKILTQRQKDGEEDWPRDYLIRLHGLEDTVQIFKMHTPQVSMIPMTNGDQLLNKE
jgi:hypothetical protein